MSSYIKKMLSSTTAEEKQCAQILFDDSIEVQMSDQRLNNLAAHTYNAGLCEKIFAMIEKCLSPSDYEWRTMHKALLLLRTIVMYGSELAVDKATQICRFVFPLQEYNSALVKKAGYFSSSGGRGTDYGAPVRAEAKILVPILMDDNSIRKARADARAGQESLVPVGEFVPTSSSSGLLEFDFGQGVTSSVGAKFGMEAVPGMYDGRPDRYFDNSNDRRSANVTTGDHQSTREAQAPSLLDLAFDSVGTTELPDAQYLPALEKQRQLEEQLAEQARQLEALKLQQQQQQVQQSAVVPSNQPHGASQFGGSGYGGQVDLLNMTVPLSTAQSTFPPYGAGQWGQPGGVAQPQFGQMDIGTGMAQMGLAQMSMDMGQMGMGMSQPQMSMSNMGMGQPQMGIGMGMSQPQMGMGQPQMGMGQPQMSMSNMGMGQPQMGMGMGMGQPQMGMGMGMGQPQMSTSNMGMGQPQMGMGMSQPQMSMSNMGMGQPQMGIGMGMGHSQWGAGAPSVVAGPANTPQWGNGQHQAITSTNGFAATASSSSSASSHLASPNGGGAYYPSTSSPSFVSEASPPAVPYSTTPGVYNPSMIPPAGPTISPPIPPPAIPAIPSGSFDLQQPMYAPPPPPPVPSIPPPTHTSLDAYGSYGGYPTMPSGPPSGPPPPVPSAPPPNMF